MDHTICKELSGHKPLGQGEIQWMKGGTAIFEDRTSKFKVEGTIRWMLERANWNNRGIKPMILRLFLMHCKQILLHME